MNRNLWFVGFGALLLGAIVLLPLSVMALPDVVASHFDHGGDANGFMPRGRYLAVILAMTVALPALLVGSVALAAAKMAPLLKVPHRAHWLAPQRRAESVAFLQVHMARLGCLLVLFFGGLHGLTMQANRAGPPVHLPLPELLCLLAAFVAGMLAWKWALHRRFRSPDQTG